MVGGTVYYSNRWADGKVIVTVEDDGNKCKIDLKWGPKSLTVKPGDSIWWQSGTAYWTTKDQSFVDEPIEMLGRSYND